MLSVRPSPGSVARPGGAAGPLSAACKALCPRAIHVKTNLKSQACSVKWWAHPSVWISCEDFVRLKRNGFLVGHFPDIWEPHQIEHGECLEAQVGPLQLWVRKSGDEIHIATKHRKDIESLTKVSAFRAVSELKRTGLDWYRGNRDWVCISDKRVQYYQWIISYF